MVGISVIICCYNSSQRLPKTLSYLALQKLPEKFPWEIILVNNNSTDNTSAIAKLEWNNHKVDVSFKIVDEPKPGLSNARKKGTELAQYEYLLFCDDDNWLFENYVFEAFRIMQTDSKIGMLGGIGFPITETEPQKWHDMTIYATGRQGETEEDITILKGYVYGAGAVIRKECLLKKESLKINSLLLDRVGDSLLSGGDVELGYHLRILNYKIYYSNKLEFYHYIPSNRLSWGYVKKLYYSFGFCSSLYIIQGIYFTNPNKKDYKYSWYWLLGNSVIHLFRKLFLKIYNGIFFKNSKYHYAVLLQDIGLCKGILVHRKK